MNIHKVAIGTHALIEAMPETPLLQSPEDVVDIIGACFEHHVRSVLLYAENLTARFFDLSSGEAGVILQKLRNYHVRLAVVVAPGSVSYSKPFQALLREESQGDDFRIFADRTAALAWLLPD